MKILRISGDIMGLIFYANYIIDILTTKPWISPSILNIFNQWLKTLRISGDIHGFV